MAAWKLLLICAVCLTNQAISREIIIVGIVDEEEPQFASNLETAVGYLKTNSSLPLYNHNVTMKTISTRHNDSFAAMENVCQLLPSGVDVILDYSTRYVTSTIRSLSEALGIPHLASVDPSFYEWNYHQDHQTSANIEPPSSIILQAIRDLVRQENLTNVGIIYDETFDLDNKPKRLLRNIPAQHLYMKMGHSESVILEQLEKIKSAELHYLFLASSSHNANRFLGQANTKGMMSFKYSWYVITKDAKLSCSFCQSDSEVVVMTGKPVYDRMREYINYWPGIDNEPDNIQMDAAFQFDMVLYLSMSLDALLKSNQWLKLNYSDCYGFNDTDPIAMSQAIRLKDKIQNISYTGVFGDFIWTDDDVAQQQIVLDIDRVQFSAGSRLTKTPIGNWTLRDGLVAFEGAITNQNVKKSYRIITIMEPPFIFKSKDKPAGVENVYYNATSGYYFYGYCIDLIYHMNETMTFEFTLLEPEDGAYGTMQNDGTWNGMIHELMQDRADIIVAPLSVMAERENVIDFTVPYYDLVGITILMKKPRFVYTVFKFMTVLENAVWGCVFSAFIIVSVLLAVFDKFSPYSYQNNKQTWDGQGEEPRVFTLKEGLWFCMTSLTPQGGGEAPRALSGRLVAATWWMFGFIMIATYTANLAAFLTVSRLDQPIESLDDLAKQFKTKYAPQRSTSTETYFKRMADIEEKFYGIWKAMSLNDSLDQVERAKLAVWDYPVSDKFTNMWVSMEESGFPNSFTDAIERIKNPASESAEFAYIGDATQNKYATLTDCDLWEVGEEFSRKPYALAVQEGSPLKTELSSVILQLLNQRILEDLKTFWWEYDRKDCPKVEDESDGISIYNIGGVFLVIFIGIGLGLLTLGFEYYWYRVRPGAKAEQAAKENQNNAISGKEDTNKYNGQDNLAYDPRPI